MKLLKKLLCLACALCLMAGAVSAGAEANDPIYVLATRDAQGQIIYVGSAALVEDGSTLVTTRWAVEGVENLLAVNAEGVATPIAKVAVPSPGSDVRLLTLETPSGSAPMPFGGADDALQVTAVREKGRDSQSAAHVTLTAYENDPAILYTGMPGMLPGAILTNGKGELVGLTTAAYGEGVDRYVALPAEVVKERMAGHGPGALTEAWGKEAQEGTQSGPRWITGLTAAIDRGILNVDWSGCEKPENMDGALTLFWETEGNSFYSYANVTWEESFATLAALPGSTLRAWLQYVPGGDADHAATRPEASALTVTIPEAERYTDHDFRNLQLYLGTMSPADYEAGGHVAEPLQAYTVGSLSQPDTVYGLQVEERYQVSEEIDANLLLTLTAPDGGVYVMLTGYIFMPEMNESDVWCVDVTEMIADALQYSLVTHGEYVFRYYIDGQLCQTFSFTVE